MKKQEDDFLLDEEEDDDWNDNYCYECSGYGDDYSVNDEGELECNCIDCPFNPINSDDD